MNDAASTKEDGMELLETNIRKEYEAPPISQRAKTFFREQYSPTALIPAMTWIPKYIAHDWRENLYGDVFAGLTVGAFLVPQGMSYALIADLPPIYGLYTASFPVIIYALLGTSRQLAVGPVAIVSLLIGHGIGDIVPFQLADGSPNPEYIELCITVSFFCGVMNLVMGLLKLGFLTKFLSHPVVSGFTSAAAIIIATGQAKHVLGYPLLKSENIFEVYVDLFKRIGQETHVISLLMGLGVMAFLYVMSKVPQLKKIPAAMLVLVISILISWGADLESKGVKVAGDIPMGIPAPSFPSLPEGEKLSKVLVLSVVISLLGYMESVAVGLTYASKNGYHIRPDQELIAFGAANLVGSFFNAYPVAGGFGRSAVNANSGAKTAMAGLISGSLMLIVLAGMTGLFTHLPKPVLGGIVIMAVSKLVDLEEPQRLRRTGAWGDLAGYLSTFLMTLLIGVELGLAIGVGCSMLVILLQVSRPHLVVLGRVPHSGAFHDLSVIESARPIPGTLVVRLDADLWFATAQPLKDAILSHVHSYPDCLARRPRSDDSTRGSLVLASPAPPAPESSGPRQDGGEDCAPSTSGAREVWADAEGGARGGARGKLEVVILDFSGVNLIDSSALHELHEMVKDIKLVPSVRDVAIVGAKRQVRRQLLRELEVTPGAVTCAAADGEPSAHQLYTVFRKYDPEGRGAISEADCDAAVKEAVGCPAGGREEGGREDTRVVAADGGGLVTVTVVDEETGSERVGREPETVVDGAGVGGDGELRKAEEAGAGAGAGERAVSLDEFVERVEEAQLEGWDGIVKLFSNVGQAVACPSLVRPALLQGSSPRGTSQAAATLAA